VGLAAETDALALAGITVRRACAGYTVVACPERRDFWYGNVLALDEPPAPAAGAEWVRRHAEHFAGTGVQRHTLVWERAGADAEDDDEDTWRASVAGCGTGPAVLERSVVFARRTPLPFAAPRGLPAVAIRELASDAEWDAAAALDASTAEPDDPPGMAAFRAWRFGTVRAAARAGRLRMWGLWVGGAAIACAGLYAGRGLARFATPVTDARFRGRGAFRALAATAVNDALARAPGTTVVICAAAGAEPEAIYRRLGFAVVGRQAGLLVPAAG
jgi:predicted GNAT family acetyltransferase